MANFLDRGEMIHKESIRHIKDNEAEVCRTNQKMLVTLNIFYFIVVAIYYVLSLKTFSAWNVTGFYRAAVTIQSVFLVLVLFRFGKKHRSWREINFVATFFQLYVMFFVGVMSIVPVSMNQPAVYYAPIGMAFSASFIFTYYRAVALTIIEMGAYVLVAFLVKSKDVFAIDGCSSMLALVMGIFLARNLYNQRIRENESRQRIRRTGMVDLLTGLYNKSSTEFLVKNYLKAHPLNQCAIMVLDFDNFKMVNDTYGHQAGDKVLRNFGQILRKEAGEEHIAGRIGGDEFFLMVKKCNAAGAEAYAENILKQTRLINAPDGEFPFSCSIGIAIKDIEKKYTSPSEAFSDLFGKADQALYQMKEKGKNNFKIYS